MKIGYNTINNIWRILLSLKTRLSGKSPNNNKVYIRDESGNTIATILLTGDISCTLDIKTIDSLHMEKDNGWSSK